MTQKYVSTGEMVLVAIDIAKQCNAVLVQLPDESRKKFVVANKLTDYLEFTAYLTNLRFSCIIGFEATGNYHRPLAHYLLQKGFE
ncbi:MAG: IS110 family transposase, partial [Candidatus Aminicenantaceae bacterium]